jgi:hypothetical protein
MAHCGKAPDGHHQHVADARSEFIDQPPGGEQAQRVGDLKGIDNVAITHLRQADALL